MDMLFSKVCICFVVSFKSCICEMNKCLFEKEAVPFQTYCMFSLNTDSLKENCTCVQECLGRISHRFQAGHIVKGHLL